MRKVCDTLLEIEGFTYEDSKEYIHKYFESKEDLAEKLLDKIQNEKRLKEMTANPLNTALLCLLCEDFQGILPESRTQLYLEKVHCVLIRYRKRKGLPVENENLIKIYNDELKRLGLLALNGLYEDNCTLRTKSLQKKMPTYLDLDFYQLNLEAANEDRVCATALRIRVFKNSSRHIIFVANLLAKKPVLKYWSLTQDISKT